MSRSYFYVLLLFAWTFHARAQNFDPAQPCIQYCVDRSAISDKQSVLDYVRACKGNEGDACIKDLAERMGVADKDALIELAISCRGHQPPQYD